MLRVKNGERRTRSAGQQLREEPALDCAPDERCDWCGGEFTTHPHRNESRTGFYSLCCSADHSQLYWENRRTQKSFRARFKALVEKSGYRKARKALLG